MASSVDGQAGVKLAQPVGVVVGTALMAAPAVAGYAGSGADDLHRVVGPLAASFSLIAAWEATRGVRWANAVLAAALVLGPLAVDHPMAATGTGVAAALALGATTPFGGAPTHRFAGGWASLLPGRPSADTRRDAI